MAGASEAVEAALRALRFRDLSAHDLELKLEARGFDSDEREAALHSLERTGLVDDARFGLNRARGLAARGAGNALIRHELNRAGLADDLVAATIDELEPEEARVLAVVARRGPGPKTARYLRSRGFGDDVVADVAGQPGSGIG